MTARSSPPLVVDTEVNVQEKGSPMTAVEAFAGVYRLLAAEIACRSELMEGFLSEHGVHAGSVDPVVDQRYLYEALSSREGSDLLADLYRRFADAALATEGDDEVLSQLEVLQHLLAKKLWKYESPTSALLDAFTQDYDRLDQPSERRRWFLEISDAAAGEA